MFKRKIISNNEVVCKFCHAKINPILKKNRMKAEFYGARFTGKDKAYWVICPNCKKVIGLK